MEQTPEQIHEQIRSEFRKALDQFVGRPLEVIDVNEFAEQQAKKFRNLFGDRLVSVTGRKGKDESIILDVTFIPDWIEVSFTVQTDMENGQPGTV